MLKPWHDKADKVQESIHNKVLEICGSEASYFNKVFPQTKKVENHGKFSLRRS
jgi:hypothetical protein